PSLPSGMDRILKDHFDFYTKKNELPPELKEMKKFEDVKLFPDLELLNVWRSNFKGIKYDTGRVLLKGAIDALLVKGKKLIVLDYKTRGYPIKEDTHVYYIEQQALYNYILRRLGYETEDYSYLLFYHPDKIVDNVFIFHKDLVKIDTNEKIVEDLLNKALDLLDGPMPEGNCEYCNYRDINITEIKDKKKSSSTLLDY
ncbi:MAG: PD-(D/E)XK nuclease family protein, partial [Nanoarchaeota archaeon]